MLFQKKIYSAPATPSASVQKFQLDFGEKSKQPLEFGDSDLEFPDSPALVDLQKFTVEKEDTNIGLDTAEEKNEGLRSIRTDNDSFFDDGDDDVYSSDDDKGFDEEGCTHVRTKPYHDNELPWTTAAYN